MIERVRTIRTGIVGLDIALGGGIRFVQRTHLGKQDSATLVIRGGPGAGKSVLAQDLALRLAKALDGDALYACVEVLPSEIIAQRQGFEGFDPKRVVDLSEPKSRKVTEGPSLVVGMRDIPIVEGSPDLGPPLLDLCRIAVGRGFIPKVVVVDSLSEGYGLGTNAQRSVVDGVCKLAIEQGWALILIEESIAAPASSPWCFSVDTVLSLELNERSGLAQREVTVAKHRFAACEPGPHRLRFESDRIRVIPPLSAYRNAHRILSLPRPAKNRSLRIPVMGEEPDWDKFAVDDWEGRFVILQGSQDLVVWRFNVLNEIAGCIGTQWNDGSASSADLVNFVLGEQSDDSVFYDANGFVTSTLHQLIDGPEWIEEELTKLTEWHGEVARVRIGPTDRLAYYNHRGSLRIAISLLASILVKRNFIVVVYGYDLLSSGPLDLGQGTFATDLWFVYQSKVGNETELLIKIGFANEPSIMIKPAFERDRSAS